MSDRKRNITRVDPDSSPEPEPHRKQAIVEGTGVHSGETAAIMCDHTELLKSIDMKLGKLDTLDQLMSDVNKLTVKLESLTTNVDTATETAETALHLAQSVKQMVDGLSKSVTELQVKCKAIDIWKEKQIKSETYSRRDNLLFDGVAEERGESDIRILERIFEIIEGTLQINDARQRMKIVRAHRLGKPQPRATRPRTIIVKFLWYQDRKEVWEQKSKLKNSGIWLSEDFAPEVTQRRHILRPILKAAQRKYGATLRPKMVEDRLIIGGITYTTESLDKLPKDLDLTTIYGGGDDEVIPFWGRQSPFSNFFPAPIIVEGMKYQTVEHYYQSRKAELHDRQDLAIQVRANDDPLNAYRLVHPLPTNDNWKRTKRQIMTTAVKAKFQQHKHLTSLLQATGTKSLVEASPYDLDWGCGLRASNPEIKDKTKWRGQNNMGAVLEEVRTLIS